MQSVEPSTTLEEYRSQHAGHDELMNVPILRFHSLEDLDFDLLNPARYIVLDPRYTLPIDFFFVPRRNSKRLMVGLHGAEARNIADLPKFQFVTSLRSREESVLALSDSTLLHGKKLTIGWVAGNKDTPLADLLATVVNRAAAALGVSESVLVGHSAGGFAAIRIGMRVLNSRAIAINGQTVAMRHRPWVVKALQQAAFPGCGSAQEMVDLYTDRFDLRAALATREPTSSFTLFGHVEDRLTFGEAPHFQLLAEPFGLGVQGGRTSQGDAFVPCSWESSNPNPHALPGSAMPFVQLVLGEVPSQTINHTIDPTWNKPEEHQCSALPSRISGR